MDISLLHAGLAAGAALAAIPVILHLFMKQTPKHIIFPALRLIRERHKRSRKKLRIKNWLLLAARMLLVALMALALARPALHSQASLGDREVPTALALVFDTSLSMEYSERNATRLAEAKKHADEILKKTTENSKVFVVDSAESGVPVSMSPAAAKKRIDSLTLRPANRPLNIALGLAYRAVAESDLPRHEVYVLTDLERTSWDLSRPVEGQDATRKVKGGVSTYVLRLSPKEVHDIAVVEAQPSTNLATQGEPIEVKARLRSSGPAKKGLVVSFYLDKDEKGNHVKRDQKTVDIPANGEVDFSFTSNALSVGLHQGEVRVQANDPMEFDDHRFFSFVVQPALKVLVITEARKGYPEPWIDSEYVLNALDPAKNRASHARPYRVERIVPGDLAAKLKDSGKEYATIFLLNVHQLTEPQWSRLNAYVREGGGLVIGLGERVDPENYNSPIAAQVVPATLKKPTKPKEPVNFGKADLSHPIFSRFVRELDSDLSGIQVFQYWSVDLAKSARAVMSFQNAAPALIERTFQGAKTGRVLLWTLPLWRLPQQDLRGAWTDFPLYWSFWYLMYQTVPYLAGTTGERLNYEAGDDVIIPIDTSRRFTSYVVQGPDNKTSDRLSPLVSNPSLVIQAPQVVGHWSITATGQGRSPQILGFSVNPPRDEAVVAPLEPKDLDSLFGKEKYALADDQESLKHAEAVGRIGRELFPWIMALILALVTAENFLANKFYRERPGNVR